MLFQNEKWRESHLGIGSGHHPVSRERTLGVCGGGDTLKDREVALQEGTLDALARDTLGTSDFLAGWLRAGGECDMWGQVCV